MTTLEKIRSHGVLLLIIVGLAMLAFILGDFINSGTTFFQRSREYVGTIAGEQIHIADYEKAKEQLTEVYKIETGRNDFDEDLQASINEQVWQALLLENTLGAQAKEIGMTVTADELSELCIGANPHQIISQRRAFYDETGNFNRTALVQFLASLEQEPASAEQAASLEQARTYWMYWENATRLSHLQEKYVGLMTQLVGANKLDAKAAFDARQTTATVKYVSQPYYAIPDSTVKVSDSEIKKLYNQKKEQYKQAPNRTLQYISFDVVPSEQDFAEAAAWINNLKEEFATTDEIALVVNSNSDIPYNAYNYSATTIPAQYKDFAFAKGAKAGDVTEVAFQDNTYSIARIMEVGYSLPDSVQLRVGFLANADKLDSLKAAWNRGQYGDAQEAGWVTEAALTKELAEPAFTTKKNGIFTVPYGAALQVFQVMESSAATPKAKVAILSREVTPSSRTYATIYNQAKAYIVANNTEELFLAAADSLDLTVFPAFNLVENANKVAQLPSSRQIVRWAFDAKEGAISDVFECGDQFIVAALTEVKDGEYRPIADVQIELRREILNEKKAEVIAANLAGVTTLEEAAEKLDAEILTAENISLSSFRFGNAGAEPAVIGAAVALDGTALSAPIAGVQGVYLLQGVSKTTVEGEFNATSEIAQFNIRNSYSLPYQLVGLITEEAEVEDNRANFY